jgi:two-component system, NarL family, response regulator LiaR
MSERERITVLIVDDHEMVRRGAKSYLDAQEGIVVVGEAESGEQALVVARDTVPDVVLMDLVMPGMDGVEATRQLKKISPRSQVIVLTSFHDDHHVFPALKAGAFSYLLKDVKAADLAEAIRRVARGEATLHPRIAERVIQEFRGGMLDSRNLFVDLSERELEVLRLIAKGHPNARIAEELFVSVGTVKGHVSNILRKLQLADRTQAAVYAWEQGLINSDHS